jgi:ABC-2 type transport system ATP-binding protein
MWAEEGVVAKQRAETTVEARGLRKEFGGTVAVDGVAREVRKGEVCGLVGPDGAGKTTTLRMLCGALPPTAGSARLLGYEVDRQKDRVYPRLGYVSQRFSLYRELTVDENLRFRARLYGMEETTLETRRESLLTFAKLGRFRHRQAGNLSGGMRQKLALAAALLHQPEVLLLDEPTTSVDPESRGEFWQMLLGLAEAGMTVIVATAYMDEAERCRRLGLLYGGRMLVQGTPAEVRREAGLNLLEVTCDPLLLGREAARKAQGVRWVEVFGDRLHVAVDKGDAEERLQEGFENARVEVQSVQPIEAGLEDAFFELVRRSERRG